MKLSLKILRLMLIPAVVMTMFTTGDWMNAHYASVPPISLSDRMPPCHAHGAASLPVSPVHSSTPRLPASYLCCLTDHAVAVVHASDCSRPAAQFTRMPQQIEAASTILFSSEHGLRMIALFDPPGATPLRI
jgi:hypothetical protein